jgi:CRP-like cAMP-binding protein
MPAIYLISLLRRPSVSRAAPGGHTSKNGTITNMEKDSLRKKAGHTMVMETSVVRRARKVEVEFLRRVAIFSGLDDSVLEGIAPLMASREVKKHEIVWLEEEPAQMIYFVAEGLVKLFKTSDSGKEQILRLASPGDCFGHAGALNGGLHPESVQAVVPSVLYGLEHRDLDALIDGHPQVARNAIKLLATEMHHYMSLVEDLSLRCVSGRLAKMLLTDNVKGPGNTSAVLTRADMAAMTGTVREVVGKSLKTLEDRGFIHYDRHKIVIRDREALKSLTRSG